MLIETKHHSSLPGLLLDTHTQYFADTTIGTRAKNYTTTGTITAGTFTDGTASLTGGVGTGYTLASPEITGTVNASGNTVEFGGQVRIDRQAAETDAVLIMDGSGDAPGSLTYESDNEVFIFSKDFAVRGTNIDFTNSLKIIDLNTTSGCRFRVDGKFWIDIDPFANVLFFGNVTDNPFIKFLGSGLATHNGNVTIDILGATDAILTMDGSSSSPGTLRYESDNNLFLFDKSLTILAPTPILVFQDSNSAGSASVGYIEWKDSGGGRAGFFGNSSASNSNLVWQNEQAGNIVIQTTGAGTIELVGDTNVTGGVIIGPIAGEIAASLRIKTDAGGKAINLEENSGVESWSFGINVDGDLELYNSSSATPSFTFGDNNSFTLHETGGVDFGVGILSNLGRIDSSSTVFQPTGDSSSILRIVRGTTSGASRVSGFYLSNNESVPGDGDTSAFGMLAQDFNTQLVQFVSDGTGNQVVFTNIANRMSNHDHATQVNPTVYVHSDTDPDSANDEWISLTHNKTSAVIGSGSGGIVTASNVRIGDTTVPTQAALEVVGEIIAGAGAAKIKITSIGGYAIKLTNKSGANSVAGDIVETSATTADAVDLADANELDPIGIFLDTGIADGAEAWVVVAGIADVHMDAGGCSLHDRIITSATAGRGLVDNAPAVAAHFQEIGHAIEAVGANGNARCIVHFL